MGKSYNTDKFNKYRKFKDTKKKHKSGNVPKQVSEKEDIFEKIWPDTSNDDTNLPWTY